MAELKTSATAKNAHALRIPTTIFRLHVVQLLNAFQVIRRKNPRPSEIANVVFGGKEKVSMPVRQMRRMLPSVECLADMPTRIIEGRHSELLVAFETLRSHLPSHLRRMECFLKQFIDWSRGNRALYFVEGELRFSQATAAQANGNVWEYLLPETHFLLRAEASATVNTETQKVSVDTMLVTSEQQGIRVRLLPRVDKEPVPVVRESEFKQLMRDVKKGAVDQTQVVRRSHELERASGELGHTGFLIRGEWVHERKLRVRKQDFQIENIGSWLEERNVVTNLTGTHMFALWLLVALDLISHRGVNQVTGASQATGQKTADALSKLQLITEPDQIFELRERRHHEKQEGEYEGDERRGGWEHPHHWRWVGERLKWGHRSLPPHQQETIFVGYVEVRPDKKDDGQVGLQPGFVKKVKGKRKK